MLAAPIEFFLATSAASAALGGPFLMGVEAVVWTAPIGSLLIVVICLPEGRFGIDAGLLLDGEGGLSSRFTAADNLGNVVW
jgi:hypothetical protein